MRPPRHLIYKLGGSAIYSALLCRQAPHTALSLVRRLLGLSLSVSACPPPPRLCFYNKHNQFVSLSPRSLCHLQHRHTQRHTMNPPPNHMPRLGPGDEAARDALCKAIYDLDLPAAKPLVQAKPSLTRFLGQSDPGLGWHKYRHRSCTAHPFRTILSANG